ncbi:MAG: hypothetical protein LBS84_01875 [Clostridiales bacterium]|jgi:hypothetical protein|nr:hypothetical protein [Clostridiales bacterium]
MRQTGNPTKEDVSVLRELAERYAEVARLDIMEKTRHRMTENNDLKPGRPPVLLHEVPWHEMDIDGKLKLICTDAFARDMETFFRRSLFQWEYFPGDMYLEPLYAIPRAYTSTGNGFEVVENRRIIDAKNNIHSHGYIDQLEAEESVEKFRAPVLTAYPEKDKERMTLAEEILGDILPVELRGHDIYCPPWDRIARYRGVIALMLDLADRPEHTHRIMSAYMKGATAEIEQMEALGLLEYRNPYLHCTPEFTSDLPQKDKKPNEPPRLKDVWFRTMAQIFSVVSPDMHEEFDTLYTKPLADRCGLTYYGCCEALDRKIPMLRETYKNLRKIGVSPWANEESSAEQIGREYVYARKANPANVSETADQDVIRAETKKTVEVCLKYGCVYEIVLKDISTVSYKPKNLIVWEHTVRETLDEYYK